MRKITSFIAILFIVTLLSSVSVSTVNASASAITNAKVTVKINGKSFNPGVPMKVREGTTMVPLKAFLKQFGIDLIWNTEYKGYRINGRDNVILLKPNSKLTQVIALNANNFSDDSTGSLSEFKSKLIRMPVPLTEQGGVQYVPLKWLCDQLGLTLVNQGNVLDVRGKDASTTYLQLTELYDVLAEEHYDIFLDSFDSFNK